MANILTFSQLKDLGSNISYNPTTDEFLLRLAFGVYSFSRRDNGLYICDVNPTPTALVTTVTENERQYTIREVKQAKAAKDLQRRLGNPTDISLFKVLSHGDIVSKDVLP